VLLCYRSGTIENTDVFTAQKYFFICAVCAIVFLFIFVFQNGVATKEILF
jgi:hypothetical protein